MKKERKEEGYYFDGYSGVISRIWVDGEGEGEGRIAEERLHSDSSNLAYNWYKYTTWKQSGGNSYRGNKAFTV